MIINKIENDWSVMPRGVTYYFIGQPKTQKTTAASRWSDKGTEGVLILDADQGADYAQGANVIPIVSLVPPTKIKKDENGKIILDENKKPTVEIVPPDERGYYHRVGPNTGKPMPVYSMREVYTWLSNELENLPYEAIVIDTVDEVNSWIENIVKKELKIEAMGQGQWGADWGMARKKNLDVIVNLQKLTKRLGRNLILISHSKASSVMDNKVQLSPDVPKGLGNALTAKADVIGYTTIKKGENQANISFVGYDERMIGSRLRPLAQKELKFDYETIKTEIMSYKED